MKRFVVWFEEAGEMDYLVLDADYAGEAGRMAERRILGEIIDIEEVSR